MKVSEVGKGARSGKTLWTCSGFRRAKAVEISRQGSDVSRFVFRHLFFPDHMSTYQPRRWKSLKWKYELQSSRRVWSAEKARVEREEAFLWKSSLLGRRRASCYLFIKH